MLAKNTQLKKGRFKMMVKYPLGGKVEDFVEAYRIENLEVGERWNKKHAIELLKRVLDLDLEELIELRNEKLGSK